MGALHHGIGLIHFRASLDEDAGLNREDDFYRIANFFCSLSLLCYIIQASIEKVFHLRSSLHSVRLLNNISLGSFGAVEVMGEDYLVEVK